MITLPVWAVALLAIFAIIGFFTVLGWCSSPRGRRVIMDSRAVNDKGHLLMAALTNQSHRHGEPEF